MTSGGNAGAGSGANAPTAGAEGGIAESVSMASFGAEPEADIGYDDIGPGSHSGLGPAQIDAIEAASVSISRNAGSRSNQVAQRDAMVEAGVPARQAGEVAVSAMQQARSAPRGSIEERMGVFPDQIAATAATAMMPAGMGMAVAMFDQLADAAVMAGWDVQDPSGMDYGDTPQSTGGQGGVGVDMVEPAAPPPAPPPVESVAAAPAPAPAPSGPTAATGATATPVSAVGAASTQARRRGRSSTIATSTLGVPQAATVARKTLLGS